MANHRGGVMTDRWQAWDSFLDATPDTGFMQSSWWADFRATVGYEHFGPILKNGDTIVGGAMVQKFSYAPQSCFYYIQDGPVLPGEESIACRVFEAILASVEERRKTEEQTVSHLRIEPRWERLPSFVRGFRTLASRDRFTEPRNTLCVDLRPSEAAILAQMKPKGRYNISVAQRHGISVVEDTSAQGLADFLSIYKDTATCQGFRAKRPDYFQTLVSLLTSLQRGSVFLAEYQGIRLAAAVVVYLGRRATYFFGGSLVEHRRVMAPYLLHFEIMRKAKAMGHDWYDLWGTAPENEPDHPWANISVFKRKFGGREVKLVPTLDYVYDPAAYDEYVRTENRAEDRGGRRHADREEMAVSPHG
jgi:peptidoglycan pentaglycine glycine transferase (the first glycine)